MAIPSLSIFAVIAMGCGNPTPPMHPSTAAAPEQAAPGSPAAQCLATASATRTRTPNEPARVTVKHILVKYAGAERADPTVTRTRDMACMRAQEALEKLKSGTEFVDLVKEYSEEPGAASREGTVGAIERSDVVPPFADAAFELKAGEASDVVETGYGFHIILRTE